MAVALPLKLWKKNSFIRHFTGSRSRKAGLPPGTLVHLGKKRTAPVRISVMDYDAEKVQEREITTVADCAAYKNGGTVSWINVSGVHDTAIVEEVGKLFDLHPLLLEDVVHTQQRPKLEDFEEHTFLVIRMLAINESTGIVSSEQVSLILGKNFVISFQETEGDIFDPVRNRIRASKGRFRKSGPDYLTYALLDAVVDHYFVILEHLGEQIENLEEQLALVPKTEYLTALHNMKREMIFLRKSVWPLREVISGFQRVDSKFVKKSTLVYLRDVYDHTIQVIDTVETYRDILSGMLDLYLSSISNRMNEIMKVLAVFASIFIPLTFITGLYGMNFDNIPELHWSNGYFLTLGFMGLVVVSLLGYFKKKGWF